MADGVQVNPAQLDASAGWLESSASEFEDEVTRLMREVRGLVGVDWRGTAADSHGTAWDEWEEGAHRIVAALRQDAGALRSTASSIQTTDRNSASGISATGSTGA